MSLITEAYLGHVDEVSKLLDSETDQIGVNEPDAYGDTALHAAAYAGKILTVEDLVRRKANVNARNNVGSTPLHKAVLSNSLPIITCLLDNGADANIKNLAGKRPEFYSNNVSLITTLKGDSVVSKKLAVPRDRHGQLIGKGGKNLNTIRNASGAEITVPKPDEESDEVTLGGRADEIKEAERLIQEFLEKEPLPNANRAGNRGPAAVPENWPSTKLDIHAENLRYIIGPKGATIKHIQKETGVKIYIPREEDEDEQVLVSGPDYDTLEEAVNMIFFAVRTRGSNGRDRDNNRGGDRNNNNRGGDRGDRNYNNNRDDNDDRNNGRDNNRNNSRDNNDNRGNQGNRGNRGNNRGDNNNNNRDDNNRGNSRGNNNSN